jgi:hypothetical protein
LAPPRRAEGSPPLDAEPFISAADGDSRVNGTIYGLEQWKTIGKSPVYIQKTSILQNHIGFFSRAFKRSVKSPPSVMNEKICLGVLRIRRVTQRGSGITADG